MNIEITNTYEFGPKAGGQSKNLVILLHGLGSNGQDLISLAPIMAQKLPYTVFVSPDAPFACDMVPPGYPDSYQWFSLQSRDPMDVHRGVKTAEPILKAFIAEQIEKYGLSASKTALVGFSQGTMMSLYTAPRFKEPLAGVLGYSGALVGRPGSQKLPVHLIHGEADDVVNIDEYKRTKDTLEQEGYIVTGHTTPGLAHSIDEEGLKSGTKFLKDIFS